MKVLVHAQFEVTAAEERWLFERRNEHLAAGATYAVAQNTAIDQLVGDHLGDRFDLALAEELT